MRQAPSDGEHRTRTSQTFFEQVWGIVANVPEGKVTTYGAIARALGSPGAARTVGWAMRAAPLHRDLPCHRVVNVAGELSRADTFGGTGVQQSLLADEGVVFDAHGRVDMKRHFWMPQQDPS
ncbi:MAG: methylated-DNA--[protein]-cysteine S-methyltransferase [Candidatus Cryosericum sp.]|nr:methylated-DNA--[protein]-cysteine S-methyltransferase [bacterium]